MSCKWNRWFFFCDYTQNLKNCNHLYAMLLHLYICVVLFVIDLFFTTRRPRLASSDDTDSGNFSLRPLNWLCNLDRTSLLYHLKHSGLSKLIRSPNVLCCEHVHVLISPKAECTMDKLWFPTARSFSAFVTPLWKAVVCSHVSCEKSFVVLFLPSKDWANHVP